MMARRMNIAPSIQVARQQFFVCIDLQHPPEIMRTTYLHVKDFNHLLLCKIELFVICVLISFFECVEKYCIPSLLINCKDI